MKGVLMKIAALMQKSIWLKIAALVLVAGVGVTSVAVVVLHNGNSGSRKSELTAAGQAVTMAVKWPECFAEEQGYKEPEFKDLADRVNHAFNVADFGKQGSGGWFYRYGSSSKPTKSRLIEQTDGERYFQPGVEGLEFKKDFVHTGNGVAAILEWRSAKKGKVDLRVTYVKGVNGDKNPGFPDGVCLYIYKGEELLETRQVEISTECETLMETEISALALEKQESIYIAVDPRNNNAFDGGALYASIRPAGEEDQSKTAGSFRQDNNASNREDFGKQGEGGWYYMYGKNVRDCEQVSDWNEDGYINATSPGLVIKKDFIHPGANDNAVLQWVPARDGVIEIRGKYTKFEQKDGNPDWPDGVIVRGYLNEKLLFEKKVAAPREGTNDITFREEKLTVSASDRLSFMVDAGGNYSYDGGSFDISIIDRNGMTDEKGVDAQDDGSRQNIADVKDDFGSQGSNGWFYQEGYQDEPFGAYNIVDYVENDKYADRDYLEIKRDYVNTGSKGKSAVIKWRAAQNGQIGIRASYTKLKNEDANPDWPDGTRVTIYHNSRKLTSQEFAADTSREITKDLNVNRVDVKRGDYISMVVNGKENNAYDGGRYEFAIDSLSGLVGATEDDITIKGDEERTNNADVKKDFGEQGTNGWFYQYSYHTDPSMAVNAENYLHDDKYYTEDGIEIKRDYIMPSTKGKCATVKWKVAQTGKVNIYADYTKLKNEDANPDWPDGTVVTLLHNSKVLRTEKFAPVVGGEIKKELNVGGLSVKKGDFITLIVDGKENTAYDGGLYSFEIEDAKIVTSKKKNDSGKNSANLALDFGKQGSNGWYYLEGRTLESASLLAKKTEDGNGYTSESDTDLQVKKDFVQPGAKKDAMYQWVAAADGSVEVTGNYVKFGHNDANPDWPDGTKIKVYLNKNLIFEKKASVSQGEGNDNELLIDIGKRKVKKGDIFTFAVDADSNNAWDGGRLAVQIEPAQKALVFEAAPDNDANLYEDFGKQGNEGWYYGYGTDGNDFQPVYLNGEEYGSVLQNGLVLKKDGVHPSAKAGAVYRWIAGKNGTVNLEGNYYKFRNEDEKDTSADGVNVSVFLNGKRIKGMSYDVSISKKKDIICEIEKTNLEVKKNDRIDFIITARKNTAWDYGRLDMDILSVKRPDYSSVAKERTNRTNLAESFGEQGSDGWFYLEGRTPGGASLLKKTKDGDGFCSSKEVDLQVKKDFVQPGARRHAMYQWVAAKTGSVDIIGSYVKFGQNDANPDWPDGTRVMIYLNEKVILEKKVKVSYGDGNNHEIQINLEKRKIKAGDVLTFAVGAETNNAWDGGKLAVQIKPVEKALTFKKAPDNDANLFDDFGAQGHEGWYYGYGKGSSDFHPADLNANRDEYGSVLQNGLILKKDGVHPAGKAGAIYRWIAGKNGTVNLEGYYSKSKNEDKTNDSPDGVNVSVFLNGKLIEGMSYDVPVSIEEDIIQRLDKTNLSVRENDRIDFIITAHENTAWDYGRLNMDILSVTKPDYSSVSKERTNKTNLAESFGEQGSDGWFYLEGRSLDGASLLTKKTEDGAGFSSRKEADLQMKKDFVQPGVKRDAMYQWVAAEDGLVDIIGSYVKFGHNDVNPSWPDGTRVIVYQNSKLLFDECVEVLQGDGNNNDIQISLDGREIKAGDILTFSINAVDNNAWDGGRLAVQIKPSESGIVFKPAPDNDANLYEDFGAQGHEGWYYGFGTESRDFHPADLNANGDEYGSVLQDGLILKKDGVHPAKHAGAIYRFVAGENGMINLEGTYCKSKNEDETDHSPDGVNVSVFLNGKLIEGMSYDVPVSKEQDITQRIDKTNLKVRENDRIDFIITARGNTAWDYGRLDMDILSVTKPDYKSVAKGRTNKTNLADSFGEQGSDGWFYLEGRSLEGASLLTKKTEDGAGFSSRKEADLQVKKDFVQPGAKRDAMYQWVAAETGTVDIIGKYVKFGHNDANPDWPDGTRVVVYRGSDVIFDGSIAALQGDGNNNEMRINLEGQEIKAGDILTFDVNAVANSAWDGGKLAVQITPAKKGFTFKAAPDNDANLYEDFGEQGHEGWYYGYGTKSSDFELADLNANKEEYGSILHDGLILKKDGVHPAKHAGAIYRFVVGKNGIINLEGTYHKSKNEEKTDDSPDGVNVSVFLNGELIEGMSYDIPVSKEEEIIQRMEKVNLPVWEKDRIDFIITARGNTAWDYGRLDMDILSVTKPDYSSVLGVRTNQTNLADNFGEQGSDGWFYLEGRSLEGASLLTKKTEDGAGFCSRKEADLQVKKDFVQPGAKRDAMYQWVAAETGTVDIMGRYVKFGHNDANPSWPDGTRVTVYHGNKVIYDKKVDVLQGDGNNLDIKIALEEQKIKNGDILTFAVGANENAAWDGGRLAVQIKPSDSDFSFEAAPDNDANLYDDFGAQGHEGWYYGYGTKNGDFHTADLNVNGDEYNSLIQDGLILKKDGVHPSGKAGAIYRWVVGESGRINLEGSYCKSRNENAEDHSPDGVNLSVYLNGKLIEGMAYDVPASLEDITYRIDKMNLMVRKNDWIDFIITAHENTAWDYGRLDMEISSVTKPDYSSVLRGRINHTNLEECFGEQGSDGWFYLEGRSLEGASLLTEKTEDGAGFCSRKGDGPQVKKDFVEPGARRAAMYQWVVAETGTVDIIGKYVKFGHQDANPDWPDGTRVIVYHDNKKLLDEPVKVKQGDGNDNVLKISLNEEAVTSGDILTFVISANENAAWDGGRLSVQIDPHKDQINYKADSDNNADLEKDFGEQGSKGWYYGYGSSNNFKLADWRNGEYKHSIYDQLLLKKDGVQPDGDVAAIYRWIAGKDGKIDLDGVYYKSRNENSQDDAPDGVVVQGFQNGEQIDGMSYHVPVSKDVENNQMIKKIGLEVQKGDRIDFIISAGDNSGWDYGKLEMKIQDADSVPTPTPTPTPTPEPSDRTNKANLAVDFSGTQGQNGWQYGVCKWNGVDFEEISHFDADNERYVSDDGVELKKDYVHPGPNGDRSAAYRWNVPQNGKINIRVTYVKYANADGQDANGVSLRVWHNGREKKFEDRGIHEANITESKEVTITLNNLEVNANDNITFGVDPENNNSFDGGKMEIEITPAEEP